MNMGMGLAYPLDSAGLALLAVLTVGPSLCGVFSWTALGLVLGLLGLVEEGRVRNAVIGLLLNGLVFYVALSLQAQIPELR